MTDTRGGNPEGACGSSTPLERPAPIQRMRRLVRPQIPQATSRALAYIATPAALGKRQPRDVYECRMSMFRDARRGVGVTGRASALLGGDVPRFIGRHTPPAPGPYRGRAYGVFFETCAIAIKGDCRIARATGLVSASSSAISPARPCFRMTSFTEEH